MARSLSRSTRVFVSTLTKDGFNTTAMTDANTFEIKVLDGYSFSQDVASTEVGVNEAGTQPVRGTLSFNTALNPVDVSFSTYVRGYDDAGTGNCVEKILWASAMGTELGFTNSPDTVANGATFNSSATDITFALATSNANELMTVTLFFVLENTTYTVEQFNVSAGEVDFSIDGIAQINWSGQGSRVNEDDNAHQILKEGGTAVSGTDYKAVPATTTTTFLRNKLSTLDLVDNAETTVDIITGSTLTSRTPNADGTTTLTLSAFVLPGTFVDADYVGGRVRNTTLTPDSWATIVSLDSTLDTIVIKEDISATGKNWVDTNALTVYAAVQDSAVIYSIPITGATLTLENNFTYLTPEELAIVNLPLAGFAGNRVISGSLTAYLDSGAQGSGGLLQDMLAKIEGSVSNNFQLVFHMGASSGVVPSVDFTIAHAQISVPTTSVEDIISTEISFTGKPWDETNDVGSFEDTNELVIKYLTA
jgi:hypothetical protein